MTLAVERLDARPWSDEQLEPLFGGAFPEFITADQVVKQYIGRVRAWFADLSIILIDAGDAPVAAGWGVPIRWSGDVSDLPAGYTDTLRRAVEGRERAEEPDTLVICGGVVSRARTGQGLSAELIAALRELATTAGWAAGSSPPRRDRRP
jgi:hypothetical protein